MDPLVFSGSMVGWSVIGWSVCGSVCGLMLVWSVMDWSVGRSVCGPVCGWVDGSVGESFGWSVGRLSVCMLVSVRLRASLYSTVFVAIFSAGDTPPDVRRNTPRSLYRTY